MATIGAVRGARIVPVGVLYFLEDDEDMKKRVLKFLVSMVLVLAMIAPLALVASAATSGNLTYTIANNEATVTKVATSASGEVIIPETLGGKPVTLLKNGALTGCTKVTKITFLSATTKIDDNTATIPLGVTIRGLIGSLAQKYSIKYARSFNEIYTDGLAFESMGEEGDTYKVTGYVGTTANVTIPRTYEGYPVTHYSIGITLGDENEPIVLPGESFEDGVIKQITFYSPTIVIPDDVNAISDGIVICGYVDSTAHKYALKYAKPFVAIGEDPYTDGLEREVSNDGKTSEITNYTGSSADVEIPRTHDGIPVTSFTADTFAIGSIGESNDGSSVLPEDNFSAPSIDTITFYSKTIEIEDDAIPEYTVVHGYVGSTAQQYAKEHGNTFIILPEFNSASVALGSSITVNYMAYLDDTQKGAKMVFTTNDQDGVTKVTEVSGVATGTANRYMFSFTGVNPQMMGDNIYAELVLNEEVISEKTSYSVKQYCLNMKSMVDNKAITSFNDDETKYAALGTLIADVLEYGAAAQTYMDYKTNALVNAGVTGATKFVPLGDEYKQETEYQYEEINYFHSASVELNNAVSFRLMFAAKDASKVKITIGGKTYTSSNFKTTTVEGKSYYYIDTPALAATQLNSRFKAVLYVGNNVSHILPYRVSNYIYTMQGTLEEPDLTALIQKLWNYGQSAENYVSAIS